MQNQIEKALRDWIPLKIQKEQELLCQWLYIGNKDFTEPFFDETISICRSLPENGHMKKSISTIDFLNDVSKEMQVIEPSAFIFHISRCGSTLISQMLAMQSSNIVLSEVPLFDELLRYGKSTDDSSALLTYLKSAINLYGKKRKSSQEKVVLKLDSWHIHFYDELRMLYPETPFFLMYRDPHEVFLSQRKKRGMHSLPDIIHPEIFGLDKKLLITSDLDTYLSLVLESYLKRFEDILQNDKNSHALNYHHGAMQMLEIIISKTNLNVTDEERAKMQHRTLFSAKYPQEIFNEESPEESVPEYMRKCMDLFKRIEKIKD